MSEQPQVEPSAETSAALQPAPGAPASAQALVREAPRRRRRNPYRKRLPALRWAVQGLYFAFLTATGVEFYLFYRHAVSGSGVNVARPPAVEGFLPISALLGLKRLVLTGRWDEVHPAGLAIFIGALAGAVLARKAFCGWICPVGTLSRALEWAGKKTLWRRRRKETLVPRWLDALLSAPKYLILGFFAWAVLVAMNGEAVEGFLRSPYNVAVDARMLLFFVQMSAGTGAVLAGLVLLSVVVKNFWCRFLCPYGALLGLLSWMSPQKVVRDPKTCTDCKLCTKACPAEIQVHRKGSVWSPECIGCMECVAVCPVQDCLTNVKRARSWFSPYLIPALGLAAMIGLWAGARLTGHWQTKVPQPVLEQVYQMAGEVGHP